MDTNILRTIAQLKFRAEIARRNLSWYRHREGFMNSMICIDETHLPLYDPDEPTTSEGGSQLLDDPDNMIVLVVGMNFTGLAFWHTFEENVGMDADRYIAFLDDYVQEWTEQYCVDEPIIYHENREAYKHPSVRAFIENKGWEQIFIPPESPDMNPCEFFFFSYLKRRFEGRQFLTKQDLDSAIQQVVDEFDSFSLACGGMNHLPAIWRNVVELEGLY